MEDAYSKDMAVLHENGDYEYVDNPFEETNGVAENIEQKEETKDKKVHTLDEIK